MDDELEQVGGNADDDIGDAVSFMREREILFGNDSLLARYGPLLTEICTRNKVYTVSNGNKPTHSIVYTYSRSLNPKT